MPAKPAVSQNRYAVNTIGSRGTPRRLCCATRYIATSGKIASPPQYIQCGKTKFKLGMRATSAWTQSKRREAPARRLPSVECRSSLDRQPLVHVGRDVAHGGRLHHLELQLEQA